MATRSDFLSRAAAASRKRLAAAETARPLAELSGVIHDLPPARSLEAALRQPGQVSIIAEIKKASPSAGLLAENFEPRLIAGTYADGGASAISVLTEPRKFMGHLDHVRQARVAGIPVLRKDFIVSSYQVAESRVAGADAVLLIVAMLGEVGLRQLLQACDRYAIGALVEIHDEQDLEIALRCRPRIIGVNARNLRSLEVEPELCHQLAEALPRNLIRVAESGVSSPEQMAALRQSGYDAALIGQALMQAPEPAALLAELLSAGKS
jgi:indole-3-glycerol phosphate synthase